MVSARFLSLIGILSGFALAGVCGLGAEERETRQVLNGDLVYTARASARSETEAIRQAQIRAVRLLAIECSVPPLDSKIYDQTVVSRSLYSFEAVVEVGSSLDDCQTARAAPASLKRALTNQVLADLLKQPEESPAAPTKSPLAATFVERQFTPAELRSHELAMDRRAQEREALRRSLKPAD